MMLRRISSSILLYLFLTLASCGPSLLETGIPTEATVISMRDIGIGKSQKCYITVNFFTQPDKEDPKPEKPKDTNRTIDEIINDLTIDVRMGDYETAEIMIPKSSYSDYYEGQKVNIRYEKGNPTNAVIDQ